MVELMQMRGKGSLIDGAAWRAQFLKIKLLKIKFLRTTVLLALVWKLCACSFNPYVQDYVDILELTEYHSLYQHETYGIRSMREEPLADIYNQCSNEVFTTQQFYIDTVELPTPIVIERVYHDYHAYLMETVMMWGAKNEKAIKELIEHIYADNDYKTIRREAFESSDLIESQLKMITYAIKKRDSCIARQGWLYKKRRASSSKK